MCSGSVNLRHLQIPYKDKSIKQGETTLLKLFSEFQIVAVCIRRKCLEMLFINRDNGRSIEVANNLE